ncbi:MAG: hypothetical protein J4F36_07130 [Nitrosopumilaceae archaeon]|nr:hypothetical protein [Nitrosopumilaceae archaeon]
MGDKKEIKELISFLHKNDKPEVYSGSIDAKEPMRFMNRLVEIGHEAVPYLIDELKEYKKEGEERHYPEYIIKILGEIGDIRALDILSKLVNDKIALWDVDITTKSIAKIGREVVPFYLKKIKKTPSEEEILHALWVFEGLEEKDSDALKFAKEILQQYKNFDIKQFAIEVIGIHGSQKEVKILDKYMESDDEDLKDIAKNALKNILKDNPAKIRDILTKHKIIGSQRCESFGRKIGQEFNSLAFRYSQKEKFHGGNASELNEIIREYFIKKVLIKSLYELNNFGKDEGLISQKNQDKILDVWRELYREQEQHIKLYSDVISIFDSFHINIISQSKETHSFKGIYPIPKTIFKKIKDLFQDKGFETSQVDYNHFFHMSYHIIARKNNEKGCIVYLTKTEGKRIWADIRLEITGKEWSSQEIKDIQNLFWHQFDDLKNLV